MKSIAAVLCLVLAVNFIQACSDNTASPEDEIRRFISTGISAAESHNLEDLGDLMHGDYRDPKGYNKKQLANLLRAYFFRHKNIYLFTKIDAIELLTENEAVVRLQVAMAGSVIADTDALAGLRARLYQFELQLVKQDNWLLRQALWMPAKLGDFE